MVFILLLLGILDSYAQTVQNSNVRNSEVSGAAPARAPVVLSTVQAGQIATDTAMPRIISRVSWGARPHNRADDLRCYMYASLTSNHTDFSSLRGAYNNGRIVIHHTATNQSVSEMQRSFLSSQWTDLPYHYIIDTNGDIFEGRPLEMMGAHAGYVPNETCARNANGTTRVTVRLSEDYDFKAIGIALIGLWASRCERDDVPARDRCLDHSAPVDTTDLPYRELNESGAQFRSLVSLISSLVQRFNIQSIDTHQHVRIGGTVCPGGQIIALLNRHWQNHPRMLNMFNHRRRTQIPPNNISQPVSCTYEAPECPV